MSRAAASRRKLPSVIWDLTSLIYLLDLFHFFHFYSKLYLFTEIVKLFRFEDLIFLLDFIKYISTKFDI